MTDYCESCGRKTRYWVREADTGAEYPACTPQGCNDSPPGPVSPLVTCDNCEGVGCVDDDPFTNPNTCPVCLGAGQTTAVRHRAWELTRDLTGGPVLLDPECWWAGETVLCDSHGSMGTLRQMGPQWVVILPNGWLQTFPGRDMAEVYLYEQYREATA